MGESRRNSDEPWTYSSVYHAPTDEVGRDGDNTAMLVHDVRRMMYTGIAGLAIFLIIMILDGATQAGINLMIVAAGPLVIILITGELLALWQRRNKRT